MNDSFIYHALGETEHAFLEASFEYRREARLKFLSDIAAAAVSVFLFAFVFNAEYKPAPITYADVETAEKSTPAMLPENANPEIIFKNEEEPET